MQTPASQVERRLAALKAYAILDTPPERQFDEIAKIAGYVCQTPIALISLLDDHRQWFKARIGLEVAETPIDVAFCDHTIRTGNVMVIGDASTDARFSSNPLVTGAEHIRFYAGAPLLSSNGIPLGTVCTLDREPRQLEPAAIAALQSLANQAAALLELRLVSANLQCALLEVDSAKSEADRLRRLLPICSYCRDVRDDSDYWQHIDKFLRDHENITVSHGICPKCYPRVLSEFGLPEEVAQ